MLKFLLEYTDEFSAVYHNYPARFDPRKEQPGIGCVLIRREFFYDFKFVHEGGPIMNDCNLMNELMWQGYIAIKFYNVFKVKHLEAIT